MKTILTGMWVLVTLFSSNSAFARFITSDPIGLEGGINTYGYALQNPGRYIDPTGEAVPFLFWCAANPACSGPIVIGVGIITNNVVNTIVDRDNVIDFPGNDEPDICDEDDDGGGLCNLVKEIKIRDIPFNDPLASGHPVPGLKEWLCEYFCPKSGRTVFRTVYNSNLGCLAQITDTGF